MAIGPSRIDSIDRRFWFQHKNGHRLYPYKSTDQKTRQHAFRVARPGTGANLKTNQAYFENIEDVVRYVFGRGWSVRMCDENGELDGLYSPTGRSIIGTSQSVDDILTETDYSTAISAAAPSDEARRMLVSLYYADDQTASMQSIAESAGYGSYNNANSILGGFAHRVADNLPGTPTNIGDGGYGNWMQALATDSQTRNEFGHFVWTLRPEVSKALEHLDWVIPPNLENPNRTFPAETTKEVLVLARRGQGLFRKRVIEYWGGRCAVTGCALTSILLSSHIKSWSSSDDFERLDPFNGLLLTPNLDRLFDGHWISFSEEGEMLISEQVAQSARDLLRPDVTGMRLQKIDAQHAPYLADHRNIYERKNKQR